MVTARVTAAGNIAGNACPGEHDIAGSANRRSAQKPVMEYGAGKWEQQEFTGKTEPGIA